MEMNWDAFGAVAEMLGAVAVLVTLIYLALQIRQNTRSVRSASFQATTDSMNQINLLLAENHELASLFNQSMNHELDQDPVLRRRLSFLNLSLLRIWETAYYQRSEGLLQLQAWERYEHSIKRTMQTEGMLEWWQTGEFGFTKEFTEHVNKLIEEDYRRDT